MSNAAIGCLSFVARSEPRIRSGRTFFNGVRNMLETICVRVASFFHGVRKLLGKRSAGYRMLSEGPKMYNSLRQ